MLPSIAVAVFTTLVAGRGLRGSFQFASSPYYTADAQCQQRSDLIQSLPDTEFQSLPFCMYADSIKLPSSGGKKSIYYWLVESEQRNATKLEQRNAINKVGANNTRPLVLWFNGGPSCSSLIGLFHELGPFYPKQDSTGKVVLARNSFGWNRNANILFVDSPAGVGMSEAPAGSSTGDEQTASDALEFLQQFLKDHPEYGNRPVWLTGESYAGHYLPHLAAAIVAANKKTAAASGEPINLQGFLVGNPATDDSWEFDGGSKYTALFNANFLSTKAYLAVQRACNGMNPFSNRAEDMNPQCAAAMRGAGAEAGTAYHNSYAIYADTCPRSTGDRSRHLTAAGALQKHRGLAAATQVGANVQAPHLQPGSHGLRDPCIKEFTDAYLRNPAVVAAIHAPAAKRWSECGGAATYGYTRSVLDKYHQFIADHQTAASKLRILVYSGDVDSVVATVGTRGWIDSLGLDRTSMWRPWLTGGQLSGFTEQYAGGLLTFATVRDAGHEVPQYQPERALGMFESFITTGDLPAL